MSMMPIADQEFGVRAEMPAISFSYDKLVAEAKAITAKYENLVVTEDQVKDIKKDMAELNAAKNRLDKARKDVVRQINEPVKIFEAQIKEVCAIFDSTYKYLQEQVQVFVQKERDEKREEVKAIIAEELAASREQVEQDLEILILESWLNKTTSLKSVREAIKDIIQKKIETERAEHERALAIEQAVKAINAEFGVDLPLTTFMDPYNLSLKIPLAEVTTAIRKKAEKLVSQQERQMQETIAEPFAQSRIESTEAGPAQEKTISVILTVPLKNEERVNEILKQLKGLCTSFAVRRK